MDVDADDTYWATRSRMWQARAEKALVRRTKRAKAAPALTLAGHGVSLRIEGGALTVQNGFTHYPQKRETIRYFRGDVALPERIILLDGTDKWERAMKSAYAALSHLEENPPEIISELRALEASCAASYFRSWVGMPVKWRGTSRRPIPDNWRSVGPRSSPYHLAGNRNAAHPVNEILNYAYATLESEIRIKATSESYDPTIGIMHEGADGSSKFIFDLMEPERPKVDRAVLDFVKEHVFDPADFIIRTDGVCRLNPEMARMVVAKVSAHKIL